MLGMKPFYIVFLLAAAVFCGCRSAPEIEEETPAEEPAKEVVEESVVEPETESTAEKAIEDPEERPAEEETAVHEEDAEAPQAEEEQPEEDFVVTEELYNQTFDDIEAIITELNALIQEEDYDRWLTYLTQKYIEETSKTEYLGKWIQDPDRRNLKTYFLDVVVSTRSRVKLDEIEFLDDTSVYAYTVYKGEKYLLYYLIRTEEGWKIDFY